MNKIIKWGRNFMAITDGIEAEHHSHWMLQGFLSSGGALQIEVKHQIIPCKAIIVNTNTIHRFQSNGEASFTMLVDPTSGLGRRFQGLLNHQPFYVFPDGQSNGMQQALAHALAQNHHEAYLAFAQGMMDIFFQWPQKFYDDRVEKVLRLLEGCDFGEDLHQIKVLANEVGLSESRLSHLFKAETGVPLKSYIVLHKLQKTYDSIFQGENITTAALNGGFDSPSHFAYTNKLMTGMAASNILKDSEFLKVF